MDVDSQSVTNCKRRRVNNSDQGAKYFFVKRTIFEANSELFNKEMVKHNRKR